MVKKVNAVCGLAIIVTVLVHIGCEVYTAVTLSVNNFLLKMTAHTTLSLAVLHAILSGIAVFFLRDRGKGMLYPGLNIRTIIQRVSAVLMIVLLIMHPSTMELLSSYAGSNGVMFTAVLIIQILFFAVVLLHVAVSAGNALITLGLVSTEKARRNIDIAVWVICAVVFVAASVAVLKAEISLFGGGGIT